VNDGPGGAALAKLALLQLAGGSGLTGLAWATDHRELAMHLAALTLTLVIASFIPGTGRFLYAGWSRLFTRR
jgi:hypothetical protein